MSQIPATAEQVAQLYGVAKSTVYRWYESGAFDVEPTTIPSPSGTRDRLLFDRDAVGKQYEKEMLSPHDLTPTETIEGRRGRLEAFLRG